MGAMLRLVAQRAITTQFITRRRPQWHTEKLMAIHLEHIEDGFLVRWYKKPGTTRYSGTLTIVNRGNGEYEPVGWMRPKEAKVNYHCELLRQIEDELKAVAPDFRYVTGVFERDRLKAQERLWRKCYKLIPLRIIEREFNGQILHGVYVRFERLGG